MTRCEEEGQREVETRDRRHYPGDRGVERAPAGTRRPRRGRRSRPPGPAAAAAGRSADTRCAIAFRRAFPNPCLGLPAGVRSRWYRSYRARWRPPRGPPARTGRPQPRPRPATVRRRAEPLATVDPAGGVRKRPRTGMAARRQRASLRRYLPLVGGRLLTRHLARGTVRTVWNRGLTRALWMAVTDRGLRFRRRRLGL